MLTVLEELDISLITSSDSTWRLAVGMSPNVTLQSSLVGKQMWRHADAILQYVSHSTTWWDLQMEESRRNWIAVVAACIVA